MTSKGSIATDQMASPTWRIYQATRIYIWLCQFTSGTKIGEIIMQTLHDNCLDAERSQLDSLVSHLWAVLLAGGDGVRLRGLTRRIAGDSRPKQFCRIFGNTSLFEQTRARLKPLCSPDRQVFVLSRAHERYY